MLSTIILALCVRWAWVVREYLIPLNGKVDNRVPSYLICYDGECGRYL